MLRISLSLKILLLAFLNLLLLALVFFVFARLQFSFELSSFFLGQVRERVVSVSRQLALQLPETKRQDWNKLLAEYSSRYPADLYLFDSNGQQLSGQPVTLPQRISQELRNDPFAREEAEPGGPPPDDRGGPHGAMGGHRPPKPPDDAFPRRGRTPHAPPKPMGDGRRGPSSDTSLPLMRTANPTRYWVGVRIPVWQNLRDEPIHATLVWQIRSLWAEPFFFDYRPWLAVVLAVVVVSVVCWLPLIRGLTVAISHLTAATGQIANGHFDISLKLKRADELGRLSDSINQMARRLSGLVHGQKRFLSDIAHELSSPIARMQVGLGILEQRASEANLSYVSDVKEEVDHMSTLVNELLSFSRSQIGEKPTALTPVLISEVVDKVLAREGSEGVTIKVSTNTGVKALAQPECLYRALANIVRNAVRYAGSGGPIEVSARHDRDQVLIIVSDRGPGLPEEELENVFRPFYRPEFARQRETGGTGLGLAIVRDCIETCGGRVHCRNRLPNGLELTVELHAAG